MGNRTPASFTRGKILLERTAAFRRNIKNIAIKNSKGASAILSESEFFETSGGLLISSAFGETYRRAHQGSNGWSLFNFEGPYPERPKEPRKESWVNFGTCGGCETNFPCLYETDLIPITKKEWEKKSGREFIVEYEFSWFKGSLERKALPAGECISSGGMTQQHPRVIKTKIAAERAGYDCFEPTEGMTISTIGENIIGDNSHTCWTIVSAEGLKFVQSDPRFDIYYVYQAMYSSQVWAKKTPFTIRDYSLNREGALLVSQLEAQTWTLWNSHRVKMVAQLKSTELPENWNLVDEEILHLSSDKWSEIKTLHPYWSEYGEGENNFQIKSTNTLGDFFNFESLKSK
ncbi:MAG: hypothetical protein LRY41_02320 [Candidatus Pacebacteria bacterium]|nr:hypothetical protein [Candidatus Paceibacterota bacterium]